MKYLLFIAFSCAFQVSISSQTAPDVPISIPVFFGEANPSQQQSSVSQIGELSGIILLLFENADQKSNIQMTLPGEPLFWLETMGVSNKGTFIFPGHGKLYKVEILLSNNNLSISMQEDERKCAWGTFASERGASTLRLVGSQSDVPVVQKILDHLNNYLMRLHMKERKKIFIKPGFNPDTLNIVMGPDTQFNTDFDLIWLEDVLYKRVLNAAKNAANSLYAGNNSALIFSEKTKNNALVEHTAKLSTTDPRLLYGSIVILFEVMGNKNYYFLKSGKQYQIVLDYQYRNTEGQDNLSFEKIMLRNVSSGDFMEMETVDLVSSGIPVIYVDLINSVIMEDYGTWNIIQVFTVFEDIFRVVDLPHEKKGF